ncbi:MAG TPA: phospholipid carrier-dependent glycosyltransferase [Candidatus Binataceae bacterium]|nr:phospholipid carrier-dependent glycosyltransferase [Candidatus Binataceae bacterium]
MLAAKRSHRIVLAALAAAILYLPGLGRPPLWEPDEGRYGEIAREMVDSGDYVTPRDNFEVYLEKPPLVYWAEAAAVKVLGPDELAVRLPAALFSIGEVAIVAVLAESIGGVTAGIYAAIALALSPLFFGFARFATLDPALAFFLTAAMGAFYAAAQGESFDTAGRRMWMLVSAGMLAFGTLSKGPVAILLGGAIALIWLAIEGRLRTVARMPLLGCVAVFSVIAIPWFVQAEARNPGFLRFFFIHEHLQRYTNLQEHGWGPWFFIPVTIAGAWPWIVFSPVGLAGMWRNRDDAAQRSAARFIAVWFVVIFIFFSIPRSKLGTYILPAFPPLAIAAGCGMAQLAASGGLLWRRIIARTAMLSGFIAVVGAAVIMIVVYPKQPELARDGILIALALAAGAAVMYAIGRRGVAHAPYAIGAMAMAMVAAAGVSSRARMDAAPMVSYRELARAAAPYLKTGCELASYRHLVQAIPFYTHVRELRVEYRGELAEFVPSDTSAEIPSEAKLRERWNNAACMVLIANRVDLPGLTGSLQPAPKIIGCEGKKFALYKGDAPAPPEAADCLNRAPSGS